MPAATLTVKKAAAKIGCHPQWVHRLIDQGRLDAKKVDEDVVNSDYLVTVASIERYMKERKAAKSNEN